MGRGAENGEERSKKSGKGMQGWGSSREKEKKGLCRKSLDESRTGNKQWQICHTVCLCWLLGSYSWFVFFRASIKRSQNQIIIIHTRNNPEIEITCSVRSLFLSSGVSFLPPSCCDQKQKEQPNQRAPSTFLPLGHQPKGQARPKRGVAPTAD